MNGNWNNGAIWTSGTVPGAGDTVYLGSTYPSGAASTVTVTMSTNEAANELYLGNNNGPGVGTLNIGSNMLTIAGGLYIAYNAGSGQLVEGAGGSFSAYGAIVLNANSLTFGASDAVQFVEVGGGSSVTTAAAGNIAPHGYLWSHVNGGSTLNLGADLNMSAGVLNVQDFGSKLDMGGHSLTAGELALGANGNSPVTVLNRGALNLSELYVGNGMNLPLIAADSTAFLYATNSTISTSAMGNITRGVLLGSYDGQTTTLNLGAKLNLTYLDVLAYTGGSTVVDAQHHDISADEIHLGWYGNAPVKLLNTGNVQTSELYMASSSLLTLHGGDVVNTGISLYDGSVLTVQQVNRTGVTLNDAYGGLTFYNGGRMDLIFNHNTSSNWGFRWLDPTGNNWNSTLLSMIAAQEIVITSPQGYSLYDDGTYTYIMGGYNQNVVPEPSSLAIACVTGIGLAAGAILKRRRAS
jgi:hypothetical protein